MIAAAALNSKSCQRVAGDVIPFGIGIGIARVQLEELPDRSRAVEVRRYPPETRSEKSLHPGRGARALRSPSSMNRNNDEQNPLARFLAPASGCWKMRTRIRGSRGLDAPATLCDPVRDGCSEFEFSLISVLSVPSCSDSCCFSLPEPPPISPPVFNTFIVAFELTWV